MNRLHQSLGMMALLCGSVVASSCLAAPLALETGMRVLHRFELPDDAPDFDPGARFASSCECMSVHMPGPRSVVVALAPDMPGAYRFTLDAVVGGDVQHSFAVDVDVSGPPLEARDRDLYLQAEDVMQDGGVHEGVMAIDVRDAAAFATARIPGVPRMSPRALRVRRYLATRKLLLVTQGIGHPASENLCRRLRDEGFTSVHLLYGGITAWRAAGGHVEGTAAGAAIDRVRARDVDVLRRVRDWLIVSPETEPSRAEHVARVLPQAIQQGAEGEDLAAAIRAALTAREEPARVLICDADGTRTAVLREALAGQVRAPVFFVEGGAAALQEARVAQVLARSGARVQQGQATADPLRHFRQPCTRCR